jgi:hypothetical protein
LNSESIASLSSTERSGDACPNCGAPLADDQRYCLECGQRHAPMSSVLLGGQPGADRASSLPGTAPPGERPPHGAGDASGAEGPRGNAVTVIAGVGVLLLAMGVGVLIGRSGGAARPTAAGPAVITVGTAPSSTGTGASQAAPFTDDWPVGTSGYTVQLQTLPQARTQTSAVQSAKSSATAKGAKAVGALKSEDFTGLTAGNYVIYSGVFHKKAEAEKALATLRKSFPSASVIKVSSAGTSPSSKAAGPAAGGAGTRASRSRQAPKQAAEELKKASPKTYEEKSKNLPNEVET